jgi:ferritin-like metal-binding protein YciE
MPNQRSIALILEALEHERGGIQIYETAITCAKNAELREEWTKYLAETHEHVCHLEEVCAALKLDPEQMTPARGIVRELGASLVRAMEMARSSAPNDAEVIACECVVIAETKDHANWELLSTLAEEGGMPEELKEACDEVENQEDEHLYHSKGWCRELWLQALGQKAVLPPPEERKDVKTAIGAARAEQQRESMIGKKPKQEGKSKESEA